jgi:hypothetical protein
MIVRSLIAKGGAARLRLSVENWKQTGMHYINNYMYTGKMDRGMLHH